MSETSEGKVKVASMYRVRDPIANLRIRVRIAQQRSRLAELFETEEETRDSNFLECEENTFSWQEKVFSRFEAQFYSEVKNCSTELQLRYHREIIEKNITGSRLYSYTNDDSYFPDDFLLTRPCRSHLSNKSTLALPVLQNRKPYNQRYNKKVIDETPTDSRIATNHYLYSDNKVMYILADLSPSDESSYHIRDPEVLICTVTYDKIHKSLKIDPDFTCNGAYSIHGTDMSYNYWIEHASEERSTADLEIEMKVLHDEVLQKLSFREAEIFPEIQLPPSNALRLFLNLDIMSADNFPYDALFVTYYIELPQYWSTTQPERLTGRTQRCSMRNGTANFSYTVELSLDLNLSCLDDKNFSLTWPWILISVASLDSWTRYRIEGYAARPIPTTSGCYEFTLHTWRPIGDYLNTLRRFFTGGTCELQDITYCGIPTMHDSKKLEKANLRTAPSGDVKLKLNIVQQSRSFVESNHFKRDAFERLSAGRLMNSVNDVLEQFKAARERMIRARILKS